MCPSAKARSAGTNRRAHSFYIYSWHVVLAGWYRPLLQTVQRHREPKWSRIPTWWSKTYYSNIVYVVLFRCCLLVFKRWFFGLISSGLPTASLQKAIGTICVSDSSLAFGYSFPHTEYEENQSLESLCQFWWERERAGHLFLGEFAVQRPFPEREGYSFAWSLGCRLNLCSDIHIHPLLPDLVTACECSGVQQRKPGCNAGW